MSFSIITVNYNNHEGLAETIESVRALKNNTAADIQYLIIDGGSADASVGIVENNIDIVDFFISEIDNGIFDAMNKGIVNSKNDWLVFMNSGDIFYNSDVINLFLSYDVPGRVDLVYGDKFESNNYYKAKDINSLRVGEIHACHQSMFFRRDKNVMYDSICKLYADYAYVLDHMNSRMDNSLYIELPLSITQPNGVGSFISTRKRFEKYAIVYRKLGVLSLLSSIFHRVRNVRLK
jgi:glycosyltransferase involved in cell wall biosynthesis